MITDNFVEYVSQFQGCMNVKLLRHHSALNSPRVICLNSIFRGDGLNGTLLLQGTAPLVSLLLIIFICPDNYTLLASQSCTLIT